MRKQKAIIGISSITLMLILIISGCFIFLTINNYSTNNVASYMELDRIEFEIGNQKIDDFAYLLQDVDIDEIHESKYDLMIIDYSSDGSEEGELSSSDITYMKSGDDKKKLLFSYLSIGEAENYRFYWDKDWETAPPDWLDEENPQWEGNYKVKYWKAEWQQIIFQYLDRIINASFDGIYMDIVDAYEFYEGKISHPDWLMMDFVGNISNYVKNEVGEDFMVFVQNADNLLTNRTYVENIDGIGREDLFYSDNSKTSSSWQEEGINNLNIVKESNKTVLVTDYPSSLDNIYDFYTKCINEGYLGYATIRDLNRIKEYSFYSAT